MKKTFELLEIFHRRFVSSRLFNKNRENIANCLFEVLDMINIYIDIRELYASDTRGNTSKDPPLLDFPIDFNLSLS